MQVRLGVSVVCWVLFAVAEEVATPTDVKNQQRITIVLSEDVMLSDHGSDFGQHTLDSSISGKPSSDVKRHSSMRCFPTSDVISLDASSSQGNTQNVADRDTAAARVTSTTERKLPRRVTTRRTKVSRKSTKRVRQHVLDSNINEFDDDYVNADEGEDVEFSETDSEGNDDGRASGSDESDLEFETELARQMNVSQVIC